MGKIKSFLLENGLTIMMVGFVLFFACFLLVLFAGRYYNFYLLQGAKAGAILGFVTYGVGRISVFFHNRNKKRESSSL
jgi:hypothetical protein